MILNLAFQCPVVISCVPCPSDVKNSKHQGQMTSFLLNGGAKQCSKSISISEGLQYFGSVGS
uniref:Uncharacterized protein n=1 Tax=Setaria italica TaxID=4555 RepID=K3Y1A8_SETIT